MFQRCHRRKPCHQCTLPRHKPHYSAIQFWKTKYRRRYSIYSKSTRQLVRSKIIIPVFILATLIVHSCATIITGKKQALYIVSNPPGASIHVARITVTKIPGDSPNDSTTATIPTTTSLIPDSTISGITPCFIKVRRPLKDSLVITTTLPEHEPTKQILKPRFNESASLNFIIPWNWMIDAMTGSLMRYSLPDTFVLREIKKTK